MCYDNIVPSPAPLEVETHFVARVETATVTVIGNGNEAAMEVATNTTGTAGAAGVTEAETTMTEGTTGTIAAGVAGTIATT
jgi:hypothetical protein